MKIGITCYPTVGGSGVVATELGKLLAQRGHQVHFITSDVPFRLNISHHNIHFHQVSVNRYSVFQYPPYDIALASKMAEVIREEQLDVLHVHYAIPHAVCAILARQMAGTNVKIVTTLHGTDITVLGYDSTLTEAIKFGIEKSDAVTAVSQALRDETLEIIAPDKDIHVIHNFIDENVYQKVESENLKEIYNIHPNEKVLIHVSNFRKVKRVDDIIKVFSEVAKEVPAILLLVGDGPERNRLIQLTKELNIENKVRFLGKQDHLEKIYSISDLMLLLSEKESFGLVALEAMACGVPCIGTNIGGIPEVIIEGFNGYIGELGDIKSLSNLALKLLTNEELYKEMSHQAIQTPQQYFHSDMIVKKYEELYKSQF